MGEIGARPLEGRPFDRLIHVRDRLEIGLQGRFRLMVGIFQAARHGPHEGLHRIRLLRPRFRPTDENQFIVVRNSPTLQFEIGRLDTLGGHGHRLIGFKRSHDRIHLTGRQGRHDVEPHVDRGVVDNAVNLGKGL